MLAKVNAYGLTGIRGYEVQLETDIHNGLPGFDMVGLADTTVKESRDRVRSAIKNSGFCLSPKRMTTNLAPADVKKEGSFYDLGVAISVLYATEQINCAAISDYIFLGELSLDGRLRHINGLMPILISAKEKGFTRFIVPKDNAREAGFVDGVDVFAFDNLRDVVDFLEGTIAVSPVEKVAVSFTAGNYREDMKYVKGQYVAKRALEIAAAGGHNVLMVGPPGAGKTMLARCIPSILPDLTPAEALETTKIHSVAGTLSMSDGIVLTRPFRSPHHSATAAALTGGGPNAKPGEISLAHNGVLFLDELPEYPRSCLEILRQPLEDGVITVARASRTVEYPADFMLVASMNPCPCGYYGSKTHECTCTPAQIAKYHSKLSGPLLDRIDLHIAVEDVTYDDISGNELSESSASIRERVNAARRVQLARFEGTGIYCNAKMDAIMLKKFCVLDRESDELMRRAFDKLKLSARAYTRILKVSRTIADLDGSENITSRHIGEALNYRSMDLDNLG